MIFFLELLLAVPTSRSVVTVIQICQNEHPRSTKLRHRIHVGLDNSVTEEASTASESLLTMTSTWSPLYNCHQSLIFLHPVLVKTHWNFH